jgi:Trp operon repressor
MSDPIEPRTTRETLVALTLDEVDSLLTRTERLAELLAGESARLETAACALGAAGAAYLANLSTFTTEAQEAAVAFIERKTSASAAATLEAQRKSMQDAATLAFADQLGPGIRDFARQVEQLRSTPQQTPRTLATALRFFAFGSGAVLTWTAVHLLLWGRS